MKQVQFGKKKARLVLKEIMTLRSGLAYIGIKGGVPSGQDPAQLSFQLVKKKRSNFLLLKSNNNSNPSLK